MQAAKTAADEVIAALKEQLRSVVEKNERLESEVDKLNLQATKDDNELERLRRLLGEKTNQHEEAKVQNKKMNNDLAILTKKHTELMTATAALDKQVETLTTQGKKDASAIAAQKIQLDESIANLTALAVEYKGYRDKAEMIASDLQAQVKKVEVDIAALKKRIFDLESQVKSITEENELAEDEIAALKRTIVEWEALCKKNAAEIASSNKRIAQLEAALATSNNELTAMSTAKTMADKEIASLTAQGQKDRDEIEALKRRILELETHQVALVKEYQAFKTATEQTIADLEAANKTTKDQMIALAKEYQSYKTTSERTVNELNAGLVKVQDEYTKHLKECKLAAEKAATTTADLEAANKTTKDQLIALAKEYQTYKTTSEKTVSDLNASLTKVKEEHAQHLKECKLAAEKAAKGIADLQSQLAALTKEYQAYKTTSEKTVSDLNATSSQLKEKLLSLAKEYQGFKSSSEMSINSVTVSLNKVQSEYAQHLNICTADKAAAQSTIDELEGFVKKPRGFECTDSVSGGNRGFSMPSKSGHVAADNKGNGSLVTYVHPGEMPSAVVTGPTDLRAAMGLSAAGATADRSAPTDLRATMGLPHGTGSVISAGGEGTESTADRPPEGVIFNWWDLITPSQ